MTMLRSVLALAAAGLALASCTEYEPLSLHGAGSMRVEVEVYKGPVTLSPEAQIGQTAAVMSDFVRAMDQWHDEAGAYLGYSDDKDDTLGNTQSSPADSANLSPEQEAAYKAAAAAYDTAKSTYEAAVTAYAATQGAHDAQEILRVRQKQWEQAQQTYEAQWSDHQRRFEHALDYKHRCVFYPTTGRYRSTQDDWRDCQALLAAYSSSRRSIDSACYIMKTPGFEALSLSIYLPHNTCEKYKTKGWDYIYKEAYFGNPDHPENEDEKTNYEILKKTWDICNDPNSVTNAFMKCSEAIVVTMEGFTTELQSTAFRTADSNIRYVPHDRNFRGLLASYAYIASEYGNQMSSRVAVLRKELEAKKHAPAGDDTADIGGLLPTGDYLRGASHSDFSHLYEWLGATDRWQPGQMNTAARVRMADRLSNDYYWEKVNQVYASGQGDVSMAFIKDEIGNWNLKSFSNDPAKLLAAYRSVADATLKTAVKLAGMAASGGGTMALPRISAAQQAAAFATQLSGGNTAATNAPDIAAMRARVVAHIKAREQTFLTREKDAQAVLDKASAPLAAGADSAAHDLAVTDAQNKLLAVRKDAIAALRDIMEDDSAVLGEMQLAVGSKDTSPVSKEGSATAK